MMHVLYPNNTCHAVCTKIIIVIKKACYALIKSSLEISQIMTINQKPILNSKPKTIPFVKTLISALLHRYDQLLTRHPLHCDYHKETALVNNIREKRIF